MVIRKELEACVHILIKMTNIRFFNGIDKWNFNPLITCIQFNITYNTSSGPLNTERPFSRIRYGSEIVFRYSILSFWSDQEWSKSLLATAQILSEIRMGQNPTLLLPAEHEQQSLQLYYLD